MALGAAWGERQQGIESVQGLNGGLLIDGKHGRVLRGIQVQPDDVGRLLLEIGVVRQHVPLESMRLQAGAPPDARDEHVTNPQHLDDPPGPPTTKDFNGDGWPDLVWRRLVTGDNALWWMTGASLLGTTSLLPTGAGGASVLSDMNWEIRGVGDFNHDGKPDLLWQDQSTGDVAVWTFNNEQRISTSWLSLLSGTHGDPDVNWKVVGAADLNGDGQLDLVWSHVQTGALRIWHMDGLLQIDSVPIALGTGDPQWEVAGLADMNGDGHADLVWRHYGTGGIATWLLNDTQVLNTLWLSPDAVSDLTWRIAGVVDMNADGQADLVWQQVSTGVLAVWYMSGTVLGSTAYLGGSPNSDTNWRIVGVR